MFNETDLDQQQRLKCAFDDDSLLNPGKVFPQLCRCAEFGRMHVHRGQIAFSRSARLVSDERACYVTHFLARTGIDVVEDASEARIAWPRRRTRQPLEIVAAAAASCAARQRDLAATPSICSTCPGIAGIVDYEPAELILTARPATSIAEIKAAACRRGQMLAFEPPDWRGLFGEPTPSRPSAASSPAILPGRAGCAPGRARDHLPRLFRGQRPGRKSGRPAARW